jgi:membrane associated rhomboid family serine protease
MPYTTTNTQVGPEFTPTTVRRLILATVLTSIASALIDPLFPYLLHMPGPQEWLGLSWKGLDSFFVWQPVSYLFIQNNGYGGLSLFFFISLIFNMYILWIMGSAVHDRLGTKKFLTLYLGSGIVCGMGTLLVMALAGSYTSLAGPGPAIMAVLMFWTMMFPEAEIILFFLFPIKAKWLMAGLIGIILLISLSNLDLANAAFYLLGAIFGYVYFVSPWELMRLSRWGNRAARFFASAKKLVSLQKTYDASPHLKGKIIDFHTGEELKDDEQFVDDMLAKISRSGEKSLNAAEKLRLQTISEKKAQRTKQH